MKLNFYFVCFCLLFIFGTTLTEARCNPDREFLINGDFSLPKLEKTKTRKFINGWKGLIEIGRGNRYIKDWGTQQVVELDTSRGKDGYAEQVVRRLLPG